MYGKEAAMTQYINDAFEWSVRKAGAKSDVSMKRILRRKAAGLTKHFCGRTKTYLSEFYVFIKELFAVGLRYMKSNV